MRRHIRRAWCRRTGAVTAGALLALCQLTPDTARAYTAAGDRIFPATLLLPQIAPSDEVYVKPSTLPLSGGSANAANRSTNTTLTYDKTLTDRLGVQVRMTYTSLDRVGAPSVEGFQNVDTVVRYLGVLDAPHEFLLTLGVDREFGDTGARRVKASPSGATTPTVYFGKGLGDLDLAYLRPLAISGTFGYQAADRALRADMAMAGFAVEYSIPYLESKVRSFSLPAPISNMTPITELFLTTPTANANGARTTALFAPGVSYAGEGYEVALEALLPATRATGRGVGVIAQAHLSLDYLFAESIGRPIFSEP